MARSPDGQMARFSYHSAVLRHFNRALFHPGDRVGIAVSGGADSVALLRALLAIKDEAGLVLSVVHFNHKLRAKESDDDEQFVSELAQSHNLDVHKAEFDTRRFAREKALSLEAAARELRYTFFGRLIKDATLDKVATAHTLNDQAETVLLRIFRGTGTSGLAGILPQLKVTGGAIVRPLLHTRRTEIVEYLTELKQPWREDSTNSETTFTRNRVRHELMPLLELTYNPDVTDALFNLAEIARAEDEVWAAETAEAFVRCYRNNELHALELLKLPLALQRRTLRLAALQKGATLDFPHTERIIELLQANKTAAERTIELPNAFRAVLSSHSLIFTTDQPQPKPCGFSYELPVPGEVAIPELRLTIRASLVTGSRNTQSYNDDRRLDRARLTPKLEIRNWRPGDRFWPAHTRSEKKIKELLQERHVPQRERTLWPVALSGDEIVWIRGFPVSARHGAGPHTAEHEQVVVEELPLSDSSNS